MIRKWKDMKEKEEKRERIGKESKKKVKGQERKGRKSERTGHKMTWQDRKGYDRSEQDMKNKYKKRPNK